MTAHDDTPAGGRDATPREATRGDEREHSTADSSEGPLASMDRRDYLKTVSVAGALGALGGLAGPTTGTAAAQSDWEAEADERIQENRTTDLEVVVEDADGNPVSDAEVAVEMTRHDFWFGTAVSANELMNASDDDPYRENLLELFNTAVLENQHKWSFWEQNQQLADEATQWLVDNDLRVRGHVCVWGSADSGAIPDDIQQAIDQEDSDTIIDESLEHIETIINHYGDDIVEWDVVNEVLHQYEMQAAVYGDELNSGEDENIWEGDVLPWTSDLLLDWYERAQEVAGEHDVQIAVNDFNTLSGWSYTQDWYTQQIEYLTDNGIELDSIGFQTHIAARDDDSEETFHDEDPDERLSYDDINEVLGLYDDFGAGLAITEFDTFQGDDWSGDDEKAETLNRYMKAIYGHPEGSQFLMWGFWDGAHWANDYDGGEPDAPLFEEDWTPKPAYDVYTGLVFDEWWTDEDGTTDGSGTFTATAYLGDHEVTVSADGEETTETVSVTDAGDTAQVTVTVDAEGSEPPADDCEDGIEVGDDCAGDLDDDGLYEDVDGSGDAGSNDVVTFFEEFEGDAVQSNADAFDFNDSGSVGFDDVVALFEQL